MDTIMTIKAQLGTCSRAFDPSPIVETVGCLVFTSIILNNSFTSCSASSLSYFPVSWNKSFYFSNCHILRSSIETMQLSFLFLCELYFHIAKLQWITNCWQVSIKTGNSLFMLIDVILSWQVDYIFHELLMKKFFS